LIVGRTSSNSNATSSDDLPVFEKNEPVTAGPSRVVIGRVRVPDGKGGTRPEGRVFVICFDSRQIFVYDPKGDGRIESVIRTGRGPHSLVVDEVRGLGYVGHFTDSYIGVIDLDQSHTSTYGKVMLSIGAPVAPRAQK
jgi:DNA-binding beta-propeller fold protein YncE